MGEKYDYNAAAEFFNFNADNIRTVIKDDEVDEEIRNLKTPGEAKILYEREADSEKGPRIYSEWIRLSKDAIKEENDKETLISLLPDIPAELKPDVITVLIPLLYLSEFTRVRPHIKEGDEKQFFERWVFVANKTSEPDKFTQAVANYNDRPPKEEGIRSNLFRWAIEKSPNADELKGLKDDVYFRDNEDMLRAFIKKAVSFFPLKESTVSGGDVEGEVLEDAGINHGAAGG